MKRYAKNSGFTLIELMIVVAIIAIIAAIAIPKLMSARLSANENAAISTLRSIASAQHQLESSVAVDTDADGGGEFGYFGELSGMVPMRIYTTTGPAVSTSVDDELDPPILPTGFGGVVADSSTEGIVERQGYYFKMWLPGATTAGGTTPGVAEASTGGGNSTLPDPDNAEILWACYAWPVDAEKTGNRVLFINQEGDLMQFGNRDESYEGLTGPAFDAVFSNASGGSDMSTDLGITAMGFTANDGNIWTIVGN